MMNSPPPIDPDKRFCILCRKKNPPIDTILILGENINEYRWNTKTNYCNDCNKNYQREWSKSNSRKAKNTKHERLKLEEQLEQFEREWNDPEFKNMKEIPDKLVCVLNKYDRRTPERGYFKQVYIQVMFPDYWNISAAGVVEEMLKTRNASKLIQNDHRHTLLLYIPEFVDLFKGLFRRKGINKFDGTVDAVNHKYAGKEKFVASRKYLDPQTQIPETRWYLLSYKPELDERTEINKNKQRRLDVVMEQEKSLVEIHEKEKEQDIKEKDQQQKDEEEDDYQF